MAALSTLYLSPMVLGRGAILGLFAIDSLAKTELGLGFTLGAGRDQRFQLRERNGLFLNEWRLRHDP